MSSVIPFIRFIDIGEQEDLAKQSLEIKRKQLRDRTVKLNGASVLSGDEQRELARLEALWKIRDKVKVDPLFVAAREALLGTQTGTIPLKVDHDRNGVIEFLDIDLPNEAFLERFNQAVDRAERQRLIDQLQPWNAALSRAALILGLLQLRPAPLPPVVKAAGRDDTVPDTTHRNAAAFVEAFVRAYGFASGNLPLAQQVLKLVAEAVDIRSDGRVPAVSALEFAKVVDRLVSHGVTAGDPNLKRRVDEALDRVQGTGLDEKPEHEIGIRLPDLEAETDYNVVEGNIRLMGPMIFASMFDELKAFRVVDRIVEMSQRGEISLTRGPAGTMLYRYWREAPNRMSEMERQTFYAMTLGLPTGQPGVAVNRDFPDLWLRFVSSVSALVRESRVDQLLRSALPLAINQQRVKKVARDLAANMSLFGYGMAFYAAVDLQKQIEEMIELLKDPDLRAAFGARDMWGVIDQVAQTDLGGARNSSRYRALAQSSAIITTWLADNVARIKDPTRPMVDMAQIQNPPSRPSGQSATTNPTDYDLVNACELWLADSAMSEDRIEELALQPRESPQQPSRPIQIPSIARDLLEQAGLGMEMSAPSRRAPARNGGRAGSYPGY